MVMAIIMLLKLTETISNSPSTDMRRSVPPGREMAGSARLANGTMDMDHLALATMASQTGTTVVVVAVMLSHHPHQAEAVVGGVIQAVEVVVSEGVVGVVAASSMLRSTLWQHILSRVQHHDITTPS